MIFELAIFVIIDALTEVIDVAVVVLREVIERALYEYAVLEGLLFKHGDGDAGDDRRLREDSRFEPILGRCARVGIDCLALEDPGSDR